MLSVLIPTLRYDPSELVATLHHQLVQNRIPFEIRVSDDAPDSPMGEVHARLMKRFPECRAVIRPSNLGAFGNRMALANEAAYDRLLYIDEDAVVTDGFIKRYQTHIEKKGNVVLGGASFSSTPPSSPLLHLRWKVGVKRESTKAALRQQNPYAGFITCNFIIDAEVMKNLPKHPEVIGYGHEDTMMGYDLRYAFVPLTHIDNPIGHAQLDDAQVFLQKTRTAIANLARLITAGKIDEDVTLYKYYRKLQTSGTTRILASYVTRNNAQMCARLSRANPPLRVYDLYKLGWLSAEMKRLRELH